MNKSIAILGSALVVLLAVVGTGNAEIFTLPPSQATVLPTGGDGVTRLALEFDLEEAGIGASGRVVWAYLEWTIDNGGSNEKGFQAYPIEESWTAAAAGQSLGAVSYSEESAADWALTSEEQELGGCLVRLDLRPIVIEWAKGAEPNHGIVVATEDIQSSVLSTQLGNAKLIVGFASGE